MRAQILGTPPQGHNETRLEFCLLFSAPSMVLASYFASSEMSRTIPIFPLNCVLYPGGMLPLRIFEQRYLDMTRDCLRDSTPFGVCRIKEGVEVGKPALPETLGCT